MGRTHGLPFPPMRGVIAVEFRCGLDMRSRWPVGASGASVCPKGGAPLVAKKMCYTVNGNPRTSARGLADSGTLARDPFR